MSRVFISYRREDTKWMARALKDRLNEAYGEDSVFMDVDSIDLGHDFVDAIEKAVAQVDVVIALIGRKWLDIKDGKGRRRIENSNDFVRIEIAAALKRDIRLIPLLERGAVMPSPDELPEDLKPLARRNALEIADTGFDQDVARLISSLNRMWEDDQKGNSVFGDDFVRGVQAMMDAEAESAGEASADTTESPHAPVAPAAQPAQPSVPAGKKAFSKWLIPALAVVCLLVVTGLVVVFTPLSNNVPSAADKIVQLDEGDVYTFGVEDFGFQDDDDNELQAIRVADLQLSGGSLKLADAAVTGDEEIAAADIAGSKLRFVPHLEGDAREPAHFSFQVTDGKDYSTSTYKITLKIASISPERRFVGHWFNKDYEASDDISLSSLRIDCQGNEIHVYPWKKFEGKELSLNTVTKDKKVEVQDGIVRVTIQDPGRFWPLDPNTRYELQVAPGDSDMLEIWLLDEVGRLGTEPKYEFEKRRSSPQLTVARMNAACREKNWEQLVACFSPKAQRELAVFVMRRHLEYFRSFAGDDHVTAFHEKYGIALERFDSQPGAVVQRGNTKEDAFINSLDLSERKSFLADALTILCDRHGAKSEQIASYLAVPRVVLSAKCDRTFQVEAKLDRIELRTRTETVYEEVDGKKLPVEVERIFKDLVPMTGLFIFVWAGGDWLLDEGSHPLPPAEAPSPPEAPAVPEALLAPEA